MLPMCFWTAGAYFKELFILLVASSLSRPVIQVLAPSAFGERVVIMQTPVYSRQQTYNSKSVFRAAL